jgi:hypothetical protein
MNPSDLAPRPCDRIIDLICDGEIFKTVRSCEMHIEEAIHEVHMEAQRRAFLDGKDHMPAVHLPGIAVGVPV